MPHGDRANFPNERLLVRPLALGGSEAGAHGVQPAAFHDGTNALRLQVGEVGGSHRGSPGFGARGLATGSVCQEEPVFVGRVGRDVSGVGRRSPNEQEQREKQEDGCPVSVERKERHRRRVVWEKRDNDSLTKDGGGRSRSVWRTLKICVFTRLIGLYDRLTLALDLIGPPQVRGCPFNTDSNARSPTSR